MRTYPEGSRVSIKAITLKTINRALSLVIDYNIIFNSATNTSEDLVNKPRNDVYEQFTQTFPIYHMLKDLTEAEHAELTLQLDNVTNRIVKFLEETLGLQECNNAVTERREDPPKEVT